MRSRDWGRGVELGVGSKSGGWSRGVGVGGVA